MSSKLIDAETIIQAAAGDVESIHRVLKHYEGYIAKVSSKVLYDMDGTPYIFVDENMKKMLETKLITSILKFNVA